MMIHRISKSRISGIISELHHLICAPTVCEKTITLNKLSLLPDGSRSFCVNAPATRVKEDALVGSSLSEEVGVDGNRISRVARAEGQATLFNYLHGTRGLDPIDAEHISRNSPRFLQNLLLKLEGGKDVSRALSKYLRYNTINEFEPFFESLGLNPHDFQSLLPRSSIYLEDDALLYDNFHVLCSYGIPRIKIGKMYKEAKEIFHYADGILSMKLRAYEELGFSKSNVIKLVTCFPSLLIRESEEKFVLVFEKLKGFRFGTEWAGKYVSDNATLNWNRMLDTMGLLMQVGYSEKQMGILFKNEPSVLFQDSGKQIFILVGQLLKLGLKVDHILYHFLENPQLLSSKCAENFRMAVSFLSEIRMETEDIASIVGTYMQVLGMHSLKRPITVMRNSKMQRGSLCQLIKKDPLQLINLASKSDDKGKQQNLSTNVEKRKFLLRLGHVENSDDLAKALKKFRGRGDQLQERFDCLVQAGLDYNTVLSMIKLAPSVLNQTKDVLEKKIDCLRNNLGYPLDAVAAFPSYLCYDLQRINLRFSMYAWLLERGKAKPMLSLSTILACSDKRFEKYFVETHPEGVAVWESLKTKLDSR